MIRTLRNSIRFISVKGRGVASVPIKGVRRFRTDPNLRRVTSRTGPVRALLPACSPLNLPLLINSEPTDSLWEMAFVGKLWPFKRVRRTRPSVRPSCARGKQRRHRSVSGHTAEDYVTFPTQMRGRRELFERTEHGAARFGGASHYTWTHGDVPLCAFVP